MPSQIEFIKPDSGLIPLFKREPVTGITKAEQVQDLLGQDIIRLTVESVQPIELNIGGKIIAYGKQYSLNQLPTAEKKGERHFIYDLTLEGPQYDLRKPVYFNTDVTGFNTSSDFPLTGNIEMFVDVLLNNANRVFGSGSWIKGVVPATEVKTITFNENNCLAALQQFCKEFEQEFDIVQAGSNRVLNIRKAGEVLGHIYEYGRGYGLYQLRRQTVTDADIITRLYPYGSNKNLKADYRNFSQRLRLPDPGYIEDAAAVAAYGVIERTRVYEDIYPKRVGTVSGVGALLTFSDASMSFDLNASGAGGTTYLLPGTSAKIHFNTGNLAGYEFELSKYVHATKSFTLIQFEDERGLLLPNADTEAFQINVGDQYVILDIMLPDEYVESAELELAAQAQLWLDQNKHPRVQYALQVDEMYLKALHPEDSITNVFSIGDYIQIKDDELGINKSSRVISLTRDILNPYRYSLTIDDTYQVSIIQTIIENQKEVKTIIKTGNLKDPNRLRMGWLTTQELLRKIFDTDGYFDGGKIKPLSVETLALVVGAKSQQFVLQNIVFEPNYEGQVNVVHVSGGYLVHYAIAETIKTWSIEETTVTIPDNDSRYIYAKVSKTNEDEGYMIFSSEQILPDEDSSYYHFLVGMLHTAIDGVRWISLTYGATAINGRFIKTGRIQSFDGLTYFDLDLGEIGGYIRFRDSAGNYRDLSDIGADMEGFYKATIINPPASYADGKVIAWFQATNPATWPGGENALHAGDTWYNPNTDTVSRYNGSGWVADSTLSVLKAYRSTYVRVGNNKSIRVFTAQPVPAYGENDLWMSEEGLRRAINAKVVGQSFSANDWVEPFNFDNTETAIDGGIITSGLIQLAGDNNSILAGISGRGTSNSSIRFWAGASTLNRNTAPFRVNQGGEVYARKRIEVEGLAADGVLYEGQAGLCGQVEEADGPIRGWAGSTYENRDMADFRYDKNGFVWMQRAQVGNMQIHEGGFSNTDEDGNFIGEANIILRNDDVDIFAGIGTNLAPATAGFRMLARFTNNEVHSFVPGSINAGAVFESSGAETNYAIYCAVGVSMLGEALINGRRSISIGYPSGGGILLMDPTKYDCINLLYPSGPIHGVKFMTTGLANTLYNGKEVTISSNNGAQGFAVMDTIRARPTFGFEPGSTVTLIYIDGYWIVKAHFKNVF